jgi:hypothetical protein
MKAIKFSHNWNNKLNCNCFTTFRVKSDKYKVGEIYAIYLKDEFICQAVIIDIKIIKLKDVNNWLAMIDTGYDKFEFEKIIRNMYKNKFENIDDLEFMIMLLKKL